MQSISRSDGAQIISEEILTSCSGGPRGNEQLSQAFISLSFLFIVGIHLIRLHLYPCRYAAVFAALVSGLACLVGIDFGAKLLASLAKCFEVH